MRSRENPCLRLAVRIGFDDPPGSTIYTSIRSHGMADHLKTMAFRNWQAETRISDRVAQSSNTYPHPRFS